MPTPSNRLKLIAVVQDIGHREEMKMFNSEDTLLQLEADYALSNTEQRIKRIFTVDTDGDVVFYKISYEDGRFVLWQEPSNSKKPNAIDSVFSE